jgi:hypothetical protein
MDFLKLTDTKTILFAGAAIFFLGLFYLSYTLEVNSLESKISILEDDKATLQEDLIKEKTNFQKCDDKRQEQNKQIEEMRVEVTYKEPETIEKVRNIYVQDKTCEAELKAYKELFND